VLVEALRDRLEGVDLVFDPPLLVARTGAPVAPATSSEIRSSCSNASLLPCRKRAWRLSSTTTSQSRMSAAVQHRHPGAPVGDGTDVGASRRRRIHRAPDTRPRGASHNALS